ncbi:hypothetical protein GCM10009030_33150 [Haloarcula pellucida]|uniref:Uncharacterized protein n=1 Tax=Haloarcula pellucida TaxID=1427151 RepID=A0A830GPC8_9EURY|nr:hypothetical protein GCM10009030_33150 [Halomicroarcula pellucida]
MLIVASREFTAGPTAGPTRGRVERQRYLPTVPAVSVLDAELRVVSRLVTGRRCLSVAQFHVNTKHERLLKLYGHTSRNILIFYHTFFYLAFGVGQ